MVYTEVIGFFLRQSGTLDAFFPHSMLWAAACVDTSRSFSSSYLMKTWMHDVSFPQIILFKKTWYLLMLIIYFFKESEEGITGIFISSMKLLDHD